MVSSFPFISSGDFNEFSHFLVMRFLGHALRDVLRWLELVREQTYVEKHLQSGGKLH